MAKKINEGAFPSAGGLYPIHFIICRDDSITPTAVLQLAHGMVEHIGCYGDLIDSLLQKGYIIAANDHAGHGRSVNAPEDLGYFADRDGDEVWLQDMHTLYEHVHGAFPELPYFLLGHSMGSFLARLYITRHKEDLTGAILCGTASYPAAASHLTGLCHAVFRCFPAKKPAALPYHLGQKLMNRAYRKTAETGTEFLSRRRENRLDHLEDPLCDYPYTWAGYRDLCSLVTKISGPRWAAKVPPSLPILLISGQDDPIGGNGHAIYQVVQLLKAAGSHPEAILYPGDRHELLQEDNREEVYEDLHQWMQTVLKKQTQPLASETKTN